MKLSTLRTLGRSGLAVSKMALGTMTFGNKGWGSSEEVSRAVFNAYVDAGGNFIDTADVYSGGGSEKLLGGFVAERQLREQLVLATKFSFAGGNSRKNTIRCLEASLGRLDTDYIDLYWMHVWDGVTPVEEMLQTMGDLVRSGKIRYFGLSDVPAWYAVKAATLAQAYGVPGPIALQLEYSLVERTIENEHLPAAFESGMGMLPWSPLAGGFLSGKYRSAEDAAGKGRLGGANPFQGPYSKFTERNWRILNTLRSVADEAKRSPAQVALSWALARRGVTSLLLGANTVEQLQDNIGSTTLTLTDGQRETLDQASAPEAAFPYGIFTEEMRSRLFGGKAVQGWRQ